MSSQPTLLSLIENEIKKAGGRERLAYVITNVEAPGWFDKATRSWFFAATKKADRRSRLNPLWTAEEVSLLVSNYKVKSRYKFRGLNRSPQAIVTKMFRLRREGFVI